MPCSLRLFSVSTRSEAENQSSIKTPDQRLRVYVSGVQDELAAERAAAIEAITSLRLSPVFLDMAARSHSQRDLYRSYVQQSHVFLGLYWQSYGVTASDEDVSRLEEELRLAEQLPKLIYVKRPAPEQQPRLKRFLDAFRSGDSVAYRVFESVDELRELVKDDLVLMLTEYFEHPAAAEGVGERERRVHLPSFVNEFIGRDEQIESLAELLGRDDVRMVTLTGPGGIGKSRLALELGTLLADRFADGVHLVMLEAIREPALVLPTIASSLELKDTASPFGDPLVGYLRERELLLVLDNLEQVVEAGPELVRFLESCPRLKMLITSRVVLNVRGEREYPVPVLSTPQNGTRDPEALVAHSAVQLFVARARAADPRFELTTENASAVAEICKRLDGLPLALELAAARIRLFDPATLLSRLDDRFVVLTGGAADLPERQRALKTTIGWSYDLLSERERRFFVALGVFRGGWTLAAAEALCPADSNALDDLQTLLDSSLIRQDRSRFSMLETVRQYAADLLADAPNRARISEQHAKFYLDFAEEAGAGLRTGAQERWLHALEADLDNTRLALRWALDHGRVDVAAEVGWSLWVFWWVRSHLAEGRRWMEEVLKEPGALQPLARTRASTVLGVMAFWQGDFAEAVPRLSATLEEFRAFEDGTGVALCQLVLGFMEASSSTAADALPRFEEARSLLEASGNQWGEVLALNALGWLVVSTDMEEVSDEVIERGVEMAERLGAPVELAMARGNLGRRRMFREDLENAEPLMREALSALAAESISSGVTYMMDAMAELAVLKGEHAKAARLFGAAEALRDRANFPILPLQKVRWDRWVDRVEREMGASQFERERELGKQMSLRDATALALGEPTTPGDS